MASNDSGGPVISAGTKEIIGVLTTTTAKTSAHYGLPAVSTATSTITKANLDFLLKPVMAEELRKCIAAVPGLQVPDGREA